MTQPVPPAPPAKVYTPDPNSREPLLSRTAIVTAASALLDAAVAFGWNLTAAQDVALLAVVNLVVAPVVLWWWARHAVYSPATVATLLSTRRP